MPQLHDRLADDCEQPRRQRQKLSRKSHRSHAAGRVRRSLAMPRKHQHDDQLQPLHSYRTYCCHSGRDQRGMNSRPVLLAGYCPRACPSCAHGREPRCRSAERTSLCSRRSALAVAACTHATRLQSLSLPQPLHARCEAHNGDGPSSLMRDTVLSQSPICAKDASVPWTSYASRCISTVCPTVPDQHQSCATRGRALLEYP